MRVFVCLLFGLSMYALGYNIGSHNKIYKENSVFVSMDGAEININIEFKHDLPDSSILPINIIIGKIIDKYNSNYIKNNYFEICYEIEIAIINSLKLNNIKSPIIVTIKDCNKIICHEN